MREVPVEERHLYDESTQVINNCIQELVSHLPPASNDKNSSQTKNLKKVQQVVTQVSPGPAAARLVRITPWKMSHRFELVVQVQLWAHEDESKCVHTTNKRLQDEGVPGQTKNHIFKNSWKPRSQLDASYS